MMFIGVPRFRVVSALFQAVWITLMAKPCLAGQTPADSGVSVSFALEQPAVTLHEPIFVALSVRNNGAETIGFDLGFNRESNLQVMVTEPNGSVILPPQFPAVGFGRVGAVSVDPGGAFRQDFLLNEWYPFLKTGVYRLQVKIVDFALKSESENSLSNQALSPVFELNVAPRSPDRLSQLCAKLENAAFSSGAFQQRTDSALTLSYVLDSVAVPHLARVALGSSDVRKTAVLGLARIANIRGLQQVLSELGTPDSDLKSSIQGALQSIRSGAQVTD